MPIKVKKGGAYVDPVGVFVKKGGVYAAAAGVSVKMAGAYVSVGAGASTAASAMKQAATRRVDVVSLFDSNGDGPGGTNVYGLTWGLSRALQTKYGCYATGIHAPTDGTGGYAAPTEYKLIAGNSSGFSSDESKTRSQGNPTGFAAAAALWPAGNLTGNALLAPRLRWAAVNSNYANLGGLVLLEGHPIGLSNALRFHTGYLRAPSGPLSGGSIAGQIRYNIRAGGNTIVIDTTAVVSSTGGAQAEVAVASYDFAAGARPAGTDLAFFAGGQGNGGLIQAPFAYLWSRAENPNAAAGVSFSTLFNVAGKCAYQMAASLQAFTPAQLTGYFAEIRRLQLVKSLKPVVVLVIDTNFNDNIVSASPAPSLGPNGASTTAGSKEAFVDNLTAVKNRILDVWTYNSWDATELNWLFVPSHIGPNYGTELPGYQAFRDHLVASPLGKADRTTVIDLTKLTYPGEAGSSITQRQAAMAALGWYSGQTVSGGVASPIPPANGQMNHLTETAGTSPNFASVGYDGLCSMIVDQVL